MNYAAILKSLKNTIRNLKRNKTIALKKLNKEFRAKLVNTESKAALVQEVVDKSRHIENIYCQSVKTVLRETKSSL